MAIGSAPATGRYPARLYRPDELPSFVRGGANASRGVTATLDPSLETERLIAYEILTPSGNWSSFPPHRHDGRFGTTYHEESYYYRLTPGDGFAIQRLYTRDTDLDVSIAAADGDLVLVHEGYHTVATAPGTNAYYLNFLAGDTKPVVQLNDPAYAWVADDWTGRPIAIPVEPPRLTRDVSAPAAQPLPERRRGWHRGRRPSAPARRARRPRPARRPRSGRPR